MVFPKRENHENVLRFGSTYCETAPAQAEEQAKGCASFLQNSRRLMALLYPQQEMGPEANS